MRPASRWIACLCVLLMLVSAVAFVAHHHSDGAEAAKCSVCVAAHTAAPASLALSLDFTMLAVSTVRTAAVIASRQRLIAFALLVRPPPEN